MTAECAICLQNDGNCFQIECTHTFHPECIISWFRSGHKTCPVCRSEGCSMDRIMHIGQPGSLTRFEYLRSISKYHTSPKLLKEIIKDYNEEEDKLFEMENSLDDYIEKRKGTFKTLNSSIQKRNKKIRTQKHKLRSIQKSISYTQYDRIIIPVRKFID